MINVIDITTPTGAAPKISKASKMPCRSWSLEAGATCPGSKDDPACEGCYAKGGNYRFKNVRAVREHNRADWRNDDWVEVMTQVIGINDLYFRWFDSGDMYALDLADKIYQVMAATPGTKHWLPTRMHKFPKFDHIIRKMELLPNVVVRKSTPGVNTEPMAGNNVSVIFSDTPPADTEVCNAPENKGKCGTCRACWDKDIRVIGYAAHGAKMAKLIKAAE